MKVSKAISAALLAATAIAGSAGAFASTAPQDGQSDLFVAVWNPDTKTSYVQDLGVTFSQLQSGSFGSNWTVDGGNLQANLGATTSGYDYQLFAGDLTPYNQQFSNSGNSAYFSLKAGAAIPTTLLNGDLINNGLNSINTYIAANLQGSTTTFTGSGSSYWASSPNGPGNLEEFTLNALNSIGGATVGNPLNLIYYLAGGVAGTSSDDPNTPVVTSAVGNSLGRGIFTLSNTGALSYQTPATVPLPPAGWLLISGLLGLVAVSRRRGTEAV